MSTGFCGIKNSLKYCLNYVTYSFNKKYGDGMKLLLLLLMSVLSCHFLFAQSAEVTIVYTNNTNGNLENCV